MESLIPPSVTEFQGCNISSTVIFKLKKRGAKMSNEKRLRFSPGTSLLFVHLTKHSISVLIHCQGRRLQSLPKLGWVSPSTPLPCKDPQLPGDPVVAIQFPGALPGTQQSDREERALDRRNINREFACALNLRSPTPSWGPWLA